MRHQIHLSFSCAMLRMLSDIVSQTVTSDINHNITEQMLTLFLLSIALWTIPCMAKSLSRDCESHQESNTLAKLKKKLSLFNLPGMNTHLCVMVEKGLEPFSSIGYYSSHITK